MNKEFKFVIADIEILKKFNLDKIRAKDTTDYYISRIKRVRRYFQTNNEQEHFVLIVAEPGSRIKKNKAITKKEAIELVKSANLVVEKKGIGHIQVLDTEGYAEHVKIFKDKSKEAFIDEIQIEFEESDKLIVPLRRELSPIKVIQKGIFDYALSNS